MFFAGRVLVLLNLMFLAGTTAWTQSQPARGGFWANIQFGYGRLARSSDQEPDNRQDAFALAFNLGGTLNRYVRFGAELNGWLLEAYDPYDPEKGESVSQTLVIVELYPSTAYGLFLKAGMGRATYTNNHPFEFGSNGWGGAIGVGCDLPVSKRIALTPIFNYSRGCLGSVENLLVSIQNRKYSVFDFRVAITYL